MFRWKVYLQRQAEGFDPGVLEYSHIFVVAPDPEAAITEAQWMYDKRTDKIENPDAGGPAWRLSDFGDQKENPELIGGI